MPGTTTPSASTAQSQSLTIHQLTVPPRAGVAITDYLTDAKLMRYEVETLCSYMLWLRAWWERRGEAIRTADQLAAAHVHDHFIDGAGFARTITRRAGFELDEQRMRDYSWGRSVQTFHAAGGAQ
ncbi:hypothetical protein [Pseudoduganella violacea]|uniref:Uncharacterized protein n=1 Tax=Pseudoduganella violacea TaxID=1715466 RepID=A0A7W5FT85_9BURK|nr:hypothetical protein [Pseudoduganella violacea]MBB3118372.1 hypothetical protein [Pseudoduganella violacea]